MINSDDAGRSSNSSEVNTGNAISAWALSFMLLDFTHLISDASETQTEGSFGDADKIDF
ncbi:putative type II secretion system protein [Roseibium sp. TrichSKD4]|nr:putative type II secretion system protein [Roseibium sp. TrichSKD4]